MNQTGPPLDFAPSPRSAMPRSSFSEGGLATNVTVDLNSNAEPFT